MYTFWNLMKFRFLKRLFKNANPVIVIQQAVPSRKRRMRFRIWFNELINVPVFFGQWSVVLRIICGVWYFIDTMWLGPLSIRDSLYQRFILKWVLSTVSWICFGRACAAGIDYSQIGITVKLMAIIISSQQTCFAVKVFNFYTYFRESRSMYAIKVFQYRCLPQVRLLWDPLIILFWVTCCLVLRYYLFETHSQPSEKGCLLFRSKIAPRANIDASLQPMVSFMGSNVNRVRAFKSDSLNPQETYFAAGSHRNRTFSVSSIIGVAISNHWEMHFHYKFPNSKTDCTSLFLFALGQRLRICSFWRSSKTPDSEMSCQIYSSSRTASSHFHSSS